MQRWIWFLAAALISTGVYFTIRYGLRPKPIPVMNATEFANLEQIGVVIYKRLRHDIRAERLVLVGSSQDVPEDFKIWEGFLKAAVADKEKVVFFPNGAIPTVTDVAGWEVVPFKNTDLPEEEAAEPEGDIRPRLDEPPKREAKAVAPTNTFLAQVKDRMKAGQLIVVHGPSNEVSHLINGSLSRRFDKLVQHPVLSISSLRLALKPEERDALAGKCLDATETGENRLACAAQKVARKYQRKNLDTAKIWAVVERHGLKEYLVFVNQP